MAIDEILLQNAGGPALRFYRWHQPSVSFGYFSRFDDALAFAAGRTLVRRWTGGGIVPHGQDLTYSIMIPMTDAVYASSSREIYRRVHEAIEFSLRSRGIEAVLAENSAPKFTDACFANLVVADVLEAGRKIAGAAHRKARTGLLHQGSIQRDDLDEQFRLSLAARLSRHVARQRISPAVLKFGQNLARQKYGTEAWLRRR